MLRLTYLRSRGAVLFLSFIVGLGLVLTSGTAQAQFARAGVSGTVSDPNGEALPGVTVTARNEATGIGRSVATSLTGRYVFNGLAPGTYTLSFELQGFQAIERTGVTLRVGQEPSVNATLELGSVQETVVVTAESPLVEVTSKQVGGAVTTKEFQNLPSQNHSFVLFAALLPGVVGSPDTGSTSSDSLFINGQDDNNNSFNVDGTNNEDDVIGARAGAQVRTAIEAIQEFQILTNQFDAEFGRTTGGVLNAVTKSGGNEFHGVGFFYYQDSDLNDKNFFTARNNLVKPESTFKQQGATVGGPIVKNRAHFFFSFERTTDEEGITRNFDTRPELNFTTSEDNLARNWVARADVQVTKNNKAGVRYLREFSPQFNQIIGSRTTQEASREENDHDDTVVATLDSVLGDTMFNNFRFSFVREDVAFANPVFNADPSFETQRAASVSLDRPGVLEGNSTVASARVNNSFQFDDSFSWYLADVGGDHDFRFGEQYSARTEKTNNSSTANGQFDFDTDRPFDPNDPTTFPVSFTFRAFGPSTVEGLTTNYTLGLFAQDDWQVTDNLTINLGVRWDWEEITEDNDNIGPRVGASWDPLGDGRTVVRGGWGRFYNRFQLGFFDAFVDDRATLDQGFFLRAPDAGSNQQLFVDFARANGITDLNTLRDALIGSLEAGAGSGFNPFPSVDNPDRKQDYADTFSIGAEHEFYPRFSIGADYVYTENKNLLVAVDLNPRDASAARPQMSILDGVVRNDFASITSFVNNEDDEVQTQSILLSANREWGDSIIGRFQGRVSYTYTDQEGNTDARTFFGNRFQTRTESGFNFDTGEFIGEPLSLGLDTPANVDRPSPWIRDHNFVASGSYLVPGTSWGDNAGLMVSGVWRWMSGDRFTPILLARTVSGARQIAPAGTLTPNISSDIALDPINFNGLENGAENPSFKRLDLSLRYAVPVLQGWQPMRAWFFLDAFNVTNETNFTDVGSTFVETGGFLIPNEARIQREWQLGVKLEF